MHKNNKFMKNTKINPKKKFNSKYGREKYLKILGESPIFFGLKKDLLWIKQNKTNKWKIMGHQISLINWGGKSDGHTHAIHGGLWSMQHMHDI